MDLTFTVSPVVLAVSAVAAGALAWWSYGRSTPAVSGPRRVGLAALRFAALFLVLLLSMTTTSMDSIAPYEIKTSIDSQASGLKCQLH